MTWIKMNHALLTSPEVVRISSALQADRLRTVGALYVLWCAADMHAEYLPGGSGLLPGYTLSAVDATVNWPGFAEAVAKAGWLVPAENGLILPHFERHNGQSAKRRAMDLERKKSVRKMSASKADKMRTREEKRREEKISLPLPPHRGTSERADRKPTRARKPSANGTHEPPAWIDTLPDSPAGGIVRLVASLWRGVADWTADEALAFMSGIPPGLAVDDVRPRLVSLRNSNDYRWPERNELIKIFRELAREKRKVTA